MEEAATAAAAADPDFMSYYKDAWLISAAVTVVGYIISVPLQSEIFYDATAGVAVVIVTIKSMIWGDVEYTRQYLSSAMCIAWAIRFGTFMAVRCYKLGADRRLNGVQHQPLKWLPFWIILIVWVMLNVGPTFVQNMKQASQPIGPLEYVGYGLWCYGFFLESVSDHQKFTFRLDPKNKNKFITHGLWKLSRHPNFFGEIIMWAGLYIAAFNALEGYEHLTALTLVFPFLITTQVSGPFLEDWGQKEWGNDPKYQKYVTDTSYFIPNPLSIFS